MAESFTISKETIRVIGPESYRLRQPSQTKIQIQPQTLETQRVTSRPREVSPFWRKYTMRLVVDYPFPFALWTRTEPSQGNNVHGTQFVAGKAEG